MTQCYLSRMDVLGYSSIYLSDPEKLTKILSEIVKDLKNQITNFNKTVDGPYKLVFHQMYGDTLDIYFECGDADKILLLALIDMTCIVQRRLLQEGLMVRGGIVFGDLIDSTYVFTGDAMIQAHKLEHSADSPNLILSEEVILKFDEALRDIFPNDLDRKKYHDKTLYQGNKLDFFQHDEVAILDSDVFGFSDFEYASRQAIRISEDNAYDEDTRKKSNKMVHGLKAYLDHCRTSV